MPDLGACDHLHPYGALAARSRPAQPDHRAGDAHGHGGFLAQIAGPGRAQHGQVARRELDGLGGRRTALGDTRAGRPLDGDPGALRTAHERDDGFGQLPAHARLHGPVEGVHAAGGPLVVDGLAGRVQGLVEAYGEGAAGLDRDERGELTAAGR